MKHTNCGTFHLLLNVRGLVCFVDDDTDYLQAMEQAYRGARPAISYCRPAEAATRLAMDNERLVEQERALAQIFAGDDITARIRQLFAWLMDTRRHEFVEVCFSDDAMPDEVGTQLLAKIPRSRIRRVLLTGVADLADAVQALNSGQIDAFLPKSDPQLMAKIRTYADYGPILQVDFLWRELSQVVRNLFEQADFRSALWAKLRSLGVEEHILLPMPLGLLCRTAAGKGLWIQFEDRETQLGAAEILRGLGWSEGDLAPIVHGEMTACLEVLPALRGVEVDLGWADITVINSEPWLGMAVFELPENGQESIPSDQCT